MSPKVNEKVNKKISESRKGSDKKASKTKDEREILYPELEVKTFKGEDAMTVEQMKELLGWQEETDSEKFGSEYLLIDRDGKKVRCTNNTKNRDFNQRWAERLGQDMLNRHWRLNGETIIIGQYGQILSGQHRGIGLILGEQQRTGEQAPHWEEKWDGPLTMECIIVFGIEETGLVTRTLDNVKPRTLADVLFCDDSYFPNAKRSERALLVKQLEWAVRALWFRSGCKLDAYSPYSTHSEMLAMIERHPKLIECVKHISEENSEKKLQQILTAGTAAGYLYLMGSSGNDADDYRAASPPSEKELDWSLWDKAQEFWVLLAAGSPKTKAIKEAIIALTDRDGMGNPLPEKTAILAKAWSLFKEDLPISSDDLVLEYETDEDGIQHLAECPTFGGIDVGDPKFADEVHINGHDPSPEQIEKGKEEVHKRAGRRAKKDEDSSNLLDGVEYQSEFNEEGEELISVVPKKGKKAKKSK